jgi:signal transduction histidine kinase
VNHLSGSTLSAEELQVRLRLQSRAFEGLFEMVKSLGNALELERVARLSLLTVAGQLRVQQLALYLPSGGRSRFRLCQAVGVDAEQLPRDVANSAAMEEALMEASGSADMDASWGLPDELHHHFDYAAYLRDARRPVALLLLGGRLPGRRLDETEENLLSAMGLVMGTMVQRALTYEHMLRAKLKMEEADRLRRVILDHVSHEFNTPLMVAKSAMELMRQAPPEKQDDLFEMHQEAVDRLGELVQSILRVADASVEEGAELPTELLTMPQPGFVSDVVSPLIYKQDLAGFHVVEGHLLEPDAFVRVDPAKIRAVLEGLLHNAQRFSRPEYPWAAVHCYATSYRWWMGHDQVERLPLYREILDGNPDRRMLPVFLPGENPPPGPHPARDMCVVLEVIDSGIGIPDGELATIFQPFAQASNSPLKGVRGAGMGLASCRRMVKEQGGELLVKSREGDGTIFAVMLPAAWGRA